MFESILILIVFIAYGLPAIICAIFFLIETIKNDSCNIIYNNRESDAGQSDPSKPHHDPVGFSGFLLLLFMTFCPVVNLVFAYFFVLQETTRSLFSKK